MKSLMLQHICLSFELGRKTAQGMLTNEDNIEIVENRMDMYFFEV